MSDEVNDDEVTNDLDLNGNEDDNVILNKYCIDRQYLILKEENRILKLDNDLFINREKSLNERLTILDDDYMIQSKKLLDSERKVTNLKKEIRLLKHKSNIRHSTLQNNFKELCDKVSQSECNSLKLRFDLSQLQYKNKILEELIDLKNLTIIELETRIKSLKTDISSSNIDFPSPSSLSNSQEPTSICTSNIDLPSSDSLGVDRIRELENWIRRLNYELETRLISFRDNEIQLRERYNNQIDDLKDEISKLKTESIIKLNEFNELKHLNSILINEKNQLKDDLKLKSDDYEFILSQNHKLNTENDSLTKQIDKYTNDIHILKIKNQSLLEKDRLHLINLNNYTKTTKSKLQQLQILINKNHPIHTKMNDVTSTPGHTTSPPEVTSTNGPTSLRPADSSSNYLSLKGDATPGDRGEESETIYGSRGEVNREATTASGKESSTGPRVEPAADLREAKGEVNKKASTASGKTSGGTATGEQVIADKNIDKDKLFDKIRDLETKLAAITNERDRLKDSFKETTINFIKKREYWLKHSRNK